MGQGLSDQIEVRPADGSRWLWLAMPAAALCAWELAARLGLVSVLFFPAPSMIARTFCRLVVSGELPANTGIMLLRLLSGFVLGAVPGLCLGLLMGWLRPLRRLLDPVVAAFHPAPKMALLPIFMIILGLGEAPKLAIIALGAFFPMLISSMAGVRQIKPIYFEVAANYNASPLRVFTHVVVPGSLPLILAGVRLGFNSALHIVVAVELLTARRGLGAMIWFAWETMRTEELYAAVAVTVFLGVAFNALLKRTMPRLVPWQVELRV